VKPNWLFPRRLRLLDLSLNPLSEFVGYRVSTVDSHQFMRVILATSSQGKLLEFREGLAPLGWELLDLSQFNLPMPPEDGATYEENAMIKAASISLATKTVALADDSGLEVEALNGAPGVYSARFGNYKTDLERNLFLLENIKNVPQPRKAKFVCVIALAHPDGFVETYRGEVEGVILEGPRGEAGFGYDPLFLVTELDKTFSELSVKEKRKISHRGRALEALFRAYQSGNPRREVSKLE
jgi:XTP/dITP diphosphohydrolase